MVFMGSAKYPSENQYDQYINSHGGACNAFTEGESTVYQFDITGEHLPKALDMVCIHIANALYVEAMFATAAIYGIAGAVHRKLLCVLGREAVACP